MAVTTFTVDNANIFFSPANWEKNSNVWAQTNDFGAYIKTVFVGTDCAIELSLAHAGAGPTFVLAYSVDGSAIQTTAALTNASTTVVVATGLADTAHTLQVWLKNADLFSSNTWVGSPPPNTFRTTGVKVTGAAPALNAPTLYAKRWVIFGDSITQGVDVTGGDYSQANTDATRTWAQQVASQSNAEVGVVGFVGMGWGVAGFNGVPQFHKPSDAANTSWNLQRAGVARSFTGIDAIVVNMGTNDTEDPATSDATVQANVTDFLTLARSTLPAGAKIYLLVPFEGSNTHNAAGAAGYTDHKRRAITLGFQAYQAATPDANAILIDVGAEGRLPLSMLDAPDQLHPTLPGHTQLAQFASSMICNGGYRTVPLVPRRRISFTRHPRTARGRPAANFFEEQIFAIPFSSQTVQFAAQGMATRSGSAGLSVLRAIAVIGVAASVAVASLGANRANAARGAASEIGKAGLGVNRATAANGVNAGVGRAGLGVQRAIAARGVAGSSALANFGIARAVAARGLAGSVGQAIAFVNRGLVAKGVGGETGQAALSAARAVAARGGNGATAKAGLSANRALAARDVAGSVGKAGFSAQRAVASGGVAGSVGSASLGISRAVAARGQAGSAAQAGIIIGKAIPARGVAGSIGKAGLGVSRALAAKGVGASSAKAGPSSQPGLAARGYGGSVDRAYLSASRALAARAVAGGGGKAGITPLIHVEPFTYVGQLTHIQSTYQVRAIDAAAFEVRRV